MRSVSGATLNSTIQRSITSFRLFDSNVFYLDLDHDPVQVQQQQGSLPAGLPSLRAHQGGRDQVLRLLSRLLRGGEHLMYKKNCPFPFP